MRTPGADKPVIPRVATTEAGHVSLPRKVCAQHLPLSRGVRFRDDAHGCSWTPDLSIGARIGQLELPLSRLGADVKSLEHQHVRASNMLSAPANPPPARNWLR
jgi:hypothetical protein